MSKTGISKLRWFFRGMAGGFIVYAAMNAISWFFRSTGWSDLCGATLNAHTEAIGFPFEIWREGAGHQGLVLANLGIHLLIGLVISTCGWVCCRGTIAATRIDVASGRPAATHSSFRLTFSVRA